VSGIDFVEHLSDKPASSPRFGQPGYPYFLTPHSKLDSLAIVIAFIMF